MDQTEMSSMTPRMQMSGEIRRVGGNACQANARECFLFPDRRAARVHATLTALLMYSLHAPPQPCLTSPTSV